MSQHLSLWILVQALLLDKQEAAARDWLGRWRKAIAGAGAAHLELIGKLLLPEPRTLPDLLAQAAGEGYLWPLTGWVPPAMLRTALADAPRAYAERLKPLNLKLD